MQNKEKKVLENPMKTRNKDFYHGKWHLTVDGQVVEVSKEIYYAYKRPLWAEHKREERSKRCQAENGHRCTKNCSQCPHSRTGAPLSLDKMKEDYNQDFPSEENVEEIVAYKILLEALDKARKELDDRDRTILHMFSNGASEREIAAVVSLSQKGVNKRKAHLLNTLYEKLKDYR